MHNCAGPLGEPSLRQRVSLPYEAKNDESHQCSSGEWEVPSGCAPLATDHIPLSY